MIDTKTTSEKLKIIKNKKVILGALALVMGLVVICLFSFVPYTLKPENLNSPEFLTDLMIMVAIVLVAMVSAMFIAQASNAQNPKSKIAKATASFISSKSDVLAQGIRKFKSWIVKVQQPNDIVTIKTRILNDNGIEDPRVLGLSIAEIKALTVPQKYDDTFYSALTQEQIDVLVELKSKGVKISLVPPEYYLNVKGILDKRTTTERASAESKKKSATMWISIVSKMILTIAFSVIWTLFARDLTKEITAAEAWAKLMARLWCFFTSVFMGYLLGCQENDIDAEYIELRHLVHLEFLEDKTFSIKSAEEEAKEAYIERVKEEQVLQIEQKLDESCQTL